MSVKAIVGACIDVVKNGKTYHIPVEDWDVEDPQIYPKGEDQMGSDVCHRYTLEGYQPANSTVSIDASVEVWEYPTGSVETVDASDNVDRSSVSGAFESYVD